MHCTLESGGAGVVACNWLAPDAGAPFQEITVIGTAGTAWTNGGKLHALGAGVGDILPNSVGNQGYMATHSESGCALPPVPGQAYYDVDTAMLDAAIQSLSDADLRSAATADAVRTSRVAVQAQYIAWQDRA